MGWVQEQMKGRIRTDEENFENSMLDLSSVVLGKKLNAAAIKNERQRTQDALEEILKYYKIKITELPKELKDKNSQLDYALRPAGVMRRPIKLLGKWWKDSIGPILAETKEGDTIALMPHGMSGYRYKDHSTGQIISVNTSNASKIEQDATCFYKPMPMKALKIKDLIKYIISLLEPIDLVIILSGHLIGLFMGMIGPVIKNKIIDNLIPSDNVGMIIPFGILLISVAYAQTFITIIQKLVQSRIDVKINMSVTSATMIRVLALPANFFREYSAGELSSRVDAMNQLCSKIVEIFLGNSLSIVFSIPYFFQMHMYAPALVLPGIIMVLCQLGVGAGLLFIKLNVQRKSQKVGARLIGLIYSLIAGIQKIKLNGAERRAYSQWSGTYKELAKIQYDPPFLLKIESIINMIITSIGGIFIYYYAVKSGVSLAYFAAFQSAFGNVSGAMGTIMSVALTFATIKPILEMTEPILKTEPEASENRQIVTSISGAIEMNNITFKYTENGPKILDNISLKIRPGQYVAIVGKTGCGKSTLLRLLLGFEKPLLGSVYFDGKDIEKLDLKSLRRCMGVVMQNGKLFADSVYSNIVISAPWLGHQEAWEAAEIAGVAEDIRNMPMEMHTLISEGAGGISGGQKQRLMIARAVAPKPKILMLDEATSALDNITQKQVSDSLAKLKSTRIVVAHRLSTIKHCDRIIMLEKGRIIEDGTYKELIAKKGAFAELVKRQQLESGNEADE